eukprot:scaffold28300_cov59-Attheya_sp.AAC.5
MKPPSSKHYKPGHGTRIADRTRSTECNTKNAPPDIKPQTPLAPYPPLPNPPPSADWTSKLKNIHKATSVPITHPPSMTRNTKSKSKSMKDELDEAAISDLMIIDPPSTSKPPSKPKPKSFSDPPNDNDTDREAWKATKIAHNDEMQRRRPDHSNKHDDEENNNDKNGYDNNDDNDENRHFWITGDLKHVNIFTKQYHFVLKESREEELLV